MTIARMIYCTAIVRTELLKIEVLVIISNPPDLEEMVRYFSLLGSASA